MSTKYLEFSLSIHGLDVKDEDFENAVAYLKGFTQTAVIGALCGNARKLFNFRSDIDIDKEGVRVPEFESDVEVELEYSAGRNGKGKAW